MSNILISVPPTSLLTGLLQLSGGVAISSTPVYVTDQNNTASVLSLGTGNVGINTTSTFARLTIVNTNTLNNQYLISASTSTASFYVRNDGYLYNAEQGRISNLLIANLSSNSLSSTSSSSSGGALYLTGTGTGIGGTTSFIPSAMAHIKGSGSTSATTSLLVQNSSLTNLFNIKDDGNVGIGESSPQYKLVVTDTNSYYGIMVNGSQAPNVSFRKGANQYPAEWKVGISGNDGNAFSISSGGSATDRLLINSSGNVGIGTTSPSAKFHLIGNGTSYGQYGLRVADSTGSTYFYTMDDKRVVVTGGANLLMEGNISMLGSTQITFPGATAWGRIIGDGSGVRINDNGSGYAGLGVSASNGKVSINSYTSPTANLTITGSGSTSATTSLLVQNSSSTQMLKITDDGKVTIGNGTTGSAILDVALGSGTSGGIRVKAYSDAGTPYLFSGGTDSYRDHFKIKMINGNVTMGTEQNGYDFGLYTFNGTALTIANAGNVGIGTTSPNASAKLDVSSTTQGFLPPRMTTAQKLAITTPASGLMVYDTTLNQMSYYNSVTWINF